MTDPRAAGPFPLRQVLVVGDLSVASTNAAWRAGLLARDRGAWLRIVHVSRRRASAERAREALDALAWELQERLNIAVLAQAIRGDFRREVVAAAREADLLVLRSAQARPLRDWLSGAHPERLIQACQRPTLVVRRPATVGYRRVLACVDGDGDAAGTVAAAAAMSQALEPSVLIDPTADVLLEKERSILADLVVLGRPAQGTPALWAPRTSSRTVLAHAIADVLVVPAPAPDPVASSATVDIALS